MSKWFGKKEEARSWNGETAGEQEQRSNDAPNNPCKNGHAWGISRTEDRDLYGKTIRYQICDCLRGCGAVQERRI